MKKGVHGKKNAMQKNNMKKSKKTIFLLVITFIVMSSFSCMLGGNVSKAAVFPINKADLYSKGEVVLFQYDKVPIIVAVTVYQNNGIEYPVYCLNKGKQGITEDHEYSVEVSQMLSNQNVWRAVVNGYPFKSPAELGCNTVSEAYAATKMAVYDAMYHYDLDKFTIHRDEDSSRRVVSAIKKIITAARNSSQTKIAATLKVEAQDTKWQVDKINKDYVSKTYNVTASASNENYQISITGENSSRWKITDGNNIEKTSFSAKEKFKILLPIAELESSGEFTIHAKSSLKTMPVFYGKTPNPEWQNFAVTGGAYEIAETTLKQNYEENKTKIEIQKQDGDTKQPLADAVFNLLDANKKLLYTELTTNSKGIIEVPYLMPGDYYLEEVQAPNGYYGYEELIPVQIGMQEKVVIKIDNFEELEEKVVPEEPTEQHITVSKKLPRTGC